MVKLATFIVDKRNLIFLLIGLMLVFSVVSRNWVKVENDLTAYLPAQSETRQGLDVMADQFTTFGSAKLMISSVTYDRAAEIADEIRSMDGVQSVTFDDSSDHYNNVSALYDITFDYPEADSACVEALNAVLERYSTYDTYLDTTLGNQLAEIIQSEVNVIMVIVAAIVGIVVWMNSNKTAGDLKVTALNWTRVIQIEANKQYSESDWSMPQGAELVETKQEISGYREVFDHYENVQVQRSRQVYDHDEYTLKDNGNGTFTQVAHPVYRTEYYTETEKRAVTRPEPIYNTKYYYTIWRWKPEREVTASGTDHNTAWPEYTLADNEREGNRTEDYRFTVEHTQKQSVPETYRLAESDWEKINVGDQIFITAKRSGANPFISDEKGNKLMDIQKVN